MAQNTSISLDDHFTSFLSQQVASGRYRSASEVVRAGLRLLEDQETQLAALRAALSPARPVARRRRSTSTRSSRRRSGEGCRLTPAAQRDLSEIWDFTETRWDGHQAEKYITEVWAAIERIAADPTAGARATRSAGDTRGTASAVTWCSTSKRQTAWTSSESCTSAWTRPGTFRTAPYPRLSAKDDTQYDRAGVPLSCSASCSPVGRIVMSPCARQARLMTAQETLQLRMSQVEVAAISPRLQCGGAAFVETHWSFAKIDAKTAMSGKTSDADPA